MSERSGYDFRGRQISPATRADWRHDARPTNYDGGRTAILARRVIRLLDALDEAEADLAQVWADGHNHAKVELLSAACSTCEDNGYTCHPHDRLYVITCPGEMCATCDYRAGEQEVRSMSPRGSRSSGGQRRRDALTGNWITSRATHKPFADDGVTYCGWATDHGVVAGCGEVWPCSTVRTAALREGAETRLAAVRALADEWDQDITELRGDARRNGDMVADWHADARQLHLRQLRAALDTECPTCSGRGVWMDEPCSDCQGAQ